MKALFAACCAHHLDFGQNADRRVSTVGPVQSDSSSVRLIHQDAAHRKVLKQIGQGTPDVTRAHDIDMGQGLVRKASA